MMRQLSATMRCEIVEPVVITPARTLDGEMAEGAHMSIATGGVAGKGWMACVALGAALTAAPAMAEDYLDTAAKSACECAERIPGTANANEVKMHAGVCMIRAVVPFKEQLRADHGVDLDNPRKDSERLGALVGARMTQHCPALMVRLARAAAPGDAGQTVEFTVEGTVTRVEKEPFVILTVQDGDGRTVKLWWLQSVPSGIDFVNTYESLAGRRLKVSYQPRDFFDPRISDYRKFNVISRIW